MKRNPTQGTTRDAWATPPEVVRGLEKLWGKRVTLDPCASKGNAKAKAYRELFKHAAEVALVYPRIAFLPPNGAKASSGTLPSHVLRLRAERTAQPKVFHWGWKV